MTNYLFCIDSDGCVMDTMTYKHELFFGPLAADIFEICDKEKFLQVWNHINLYSRTRGVNRFKGLVLCLEWAGVPNIEPLSDWVNETSELSNESLKKFIKQKPEISLEKALKWSCKVNEKIDTTEGLDYPFKNAKEGLEYLKNIGSVMIISSANKEAVLEEWSHHHLMKYVDKVACQDKGKKEDILNYALKTGWTRNQILMIGDSPGDLNAAKKNGIAFYPILVNHEEKSWMTLQEKVVPQFVLDKYDERKFTRQFWINLDKN